MDSRKILLIEDEPDIVRTLQVFLESENFKVSTATDGMEGMNKARKEKPELIILDIMLPKLDGYKICRMLKFDEELRKIPIVIFTARAQDADRQLAMEVGADAYITKPLEPEMLLTEIKKLLAM